ncbi:MAG: zf-HC2 domain-containing protein [Myxococcaceae bacterium]|nr:zf-HC2 domain-containing protein [Myxococcaceae bacterium]MCI0672651.1 zf-HC2 domain-containing protein [Myxococcaceae bacterium]
MTPSASHAQDDRLLELAYGELTGAEATAVEAHVRSCPRCTEALDAIRGVRRVMAPLASEPAPDAGLESLLAYAGQAARRSREARAPRERLVRRWVLALSSVVSVALVGVLAYRVVGPSGSPPAEVFAPASKAVAEQAAALEVPAQVAPAASSLDQPESVVPTAAPGPAPRRKPVLRDKEEVGAAKRVLQDKVGIGAAKKDSTRLDLEEASKSARRSSMDARAEADHAPAAAAAEPLAAEEPLEARAPAPAPVVEGRAPAAAAPSKLSLATREATGAGAMAPESPSAGAAAPAGRTEGKRVAAVSEAMQESRSRDQGVTPQALARMAEARRAEGLRDAEAALLERALTLGAQGTLRADLLVRLCEARRALGQSERANATCAQVRVEFPGTPEADAAGRLLGQ